MFKMTHNIFLLISLILLTLTSCTKSKELGSKENPLKFYLIPAQDIQGLYETGKVLQEFLKKELDMEVVVEIPINYVTLVEAFGSKRADVGIINTFGYILARQKYQVDPRLKLINRGRAEYNGQIIARVDGPKSIEELKGKKFAFVDPASTSGYLLPLRLFKQKNIKLKEQIFAGRHDTVVNAVYQRQVDAGATFYTPPDDKDGQPQDARMLVKTQHPDVYEKIKILQITGPIPNDPVIFRKDLPEELKVKIVNLLKKYIKSEEGSKTLFKMYHITDFKEAADADYDVVRTYLKDIDQKPEDFIK